MVVVLIVGFRHVALAQAEPAGYPEARALALSEYQAGNFEEARAEFRRAYRLFPNARMLRGIGMSEFELRNYGESIESLEDALRSDVRPLDASLRAETEALLTRAHNYIARVTLELQPGSAAVTVDRVPVTLGPGNMLLLRVGDHVLEFNAEGRASERRELRVDGGEQQTLRVTLSEPAVAPAPAPPAALTPGAETTHAAAPVEPTRAAPPAQVARARRSKPKHARADESPPEGAVLMRFRADDRDEHWSLETETGAGGDTTTSQQAVVCSLPCVRWIAPRSGLALLLHDPVTGAELAFLAVPYNTGYVPGSQLLVAVRQKISCSALGLSVAVALLGAVPLSVGINSVVNETDPFISIPPLAGISLVAVGAAMVLGGLSVVLVNGPYDGVGNGCGEFFLATELDENRAAAAASRVRLARAGMRGPNVRLSGAGVVGVF
jgi:hypothetical protein